MKKQTNVNIHNRFDIEVVDARTGEIRQKAQAHNVVCSNLWSSLINVNSTNRYFQYIYYGSGSGTPSASDTSLFTHVDAVAISGADGLTGCTYSIDLFNRVASCRRSIQLDENTAVGVTITETGIGYGGSSGLCTHAMLEDMNGNQISITKTDTDIINIYATVYCHWDSNTELVPAIPYTNSSVYNTFLAWLMGTYANSSASTDGKTPYQVRPSKENFLHGSNLLFSTKACSDTGGSIVGDVANKRVTFTMPRMAVAENNKGGIGMLALSSPFNSNNWRTDQVYSASVVFMPVSKFWGGSDITGEAVGTGDGETTRFSLAFDFPENATIYVNGVEASGVTVRRVPSASFGAWTQYYVKYLSSDSTDARNIQIPAGHYKLADTSNTSYKNQFIIYTGEIIRNMSNLVGFQTATFSNNSGNTLNLYGSDDFSTWNLIGSQTSGTITLDDTTGHYKYYKYTGGANDNDYITLNVVDEDYCAVVFDTAPSEGDVITADYHTDYIAKDSDHVFDFSYIMQFGEYTE